MFETIILAAGKGTRMKSKIPKILHRVGGKMMLQYVINAAKVAGSAREIIVVSRETEFIKNFFSEVEFVLQEEQLGTAHAVLVAEEKFVNSSSNILILCGDTPLLTAELVKSFVTTHENSNFAATVLTANIPDATSYGRVIRDDENAFQKIIEDKDATDDEKNINEINSGVYCFKCQNFFEALKRVKNNNSQGEYYLPDVLSVLKISGEKIGLFTTEDYRNVIGINSRVHLAEANKILRQRKNLELMNDGVTIIDPDTTFVDVDVKIGQDTILYPNTYLEGTTRIGEDCIIGPNVRMNDMIVGNRVAIQYSYCHDSEICDNITIGPYVHIRPGTKVSDDVKIGNFVEIKNSNIGTGSKLPHLQYIGDCDLGSSCNIGCGAITVNYDGKKKYRTTIGDNVFVGCNSNLVAPVKIENNAYIAAGSTITKDVPKRNLAIARSHQRNIDNWKDKRN